MVKLIVKWLLLAAALLFVAYLYSGVQVRSFGAALLAAFVIGLFNTVLRPILVVLTLPVTVVTLGLFLFVIKALMFWAASALLDGFQVTSFVAALVGSVIYSFHRHHHRVSARAPVREEVIRPGARGCR